ncbi:MAG: rRNA maturation RNase YbeY [Bacteroidetes bacterium]|nr:MAG: rRNA maturation RNase YbeY [Bacteroidota bacterium]
MHADSRVNKIRFHFLKKGFTLGNRTFLKSFLLDFFKREGFQVDVVNYIFCSDTYLKRLNKSHLGHNYNTDILTFVMSPAKNPLLVDIFISIDTVRTNSVRFDNPFSVELRRVIFHGALHACGYEDRTISQKKEMRKREDSLLSGYRRRST